MIGASETEALLAAGTGNYSTIAMPSPTPEDWQSCGHSSGKIITETILPGIAKTVWLATIAGGCYLSFTGGVQGIELFTPNDVKYLVGAVSAATTFQILRQSPVSLDEFRKNFLPGLLFGVGYSFTSGLLTYKQAPTYWQKWTFSILNGLANMPFSFESTNNMFDNVTNYHTVWNQSNTKTRAILFFNFAIIFLTVCCTLIGFAAPFVELFIGWTLSNFGTYLVSGILCVILNCVELFFQINEMICLKTDENCRAWFSFVRNPFPDDAWDNKLRSIISSILAFIQAICYGTFSYQVLLSASQPLAILVGITSLIAPIMSGIKPADKFVSAPIADSIFYIGEKFAAGFNWCFPQGLRHSLTQLCQPCPKIPSCRGKDIIQV